MFIVWKWCQNSGELAMSYSWDGYKQYLQSKKLLLAKCALDADHIPSCWSMEALASLRDG
ncbi:unnamed protein product [Acanthoscelides obtectus]|uniref:Uncharacterized protein n=1 Tax=Acanthoscelides obtectus TaxID=200917 RepID=A0A9P0KIN7_ACAOB|nr:unnamed protein product [Acanthoscelides obtectus]CAK1623624.1 hypothetical protein AOBTE_LOCUS2097 [Acanthoscelides obtectus]